MKLHFIVAMLIDPYTPFTTIVQHERFTIKGFTMHIAVFLQGAIRMKTLKMLTTILKDKDIKDNL